MVVQAMQVNECVTQHNDVVGGMERLYRQPIPPSYTGSALPKRPSLNHIVGCRQGLNLCRNGAAKCDSVWRITAACVCMNVFSKVTRPRCRHTSRFLVIWTCFLPFALWPKFEWLTPAMAIVVCTQPSLPVVQCLCHADLQCSLLR